MVDLERIILRTSKIFVFSNGYNIVLAWKPAADNKGAVSARLPSVLTPVDDASE